MPKTRNKRDEIPASVPRGVIPLVKLVYALMLKREITYGEVAEESGVGYCSLSDQWRTRSGQSVQNLEAVLNTLGYKLAAVPVKVPLDEFGRLARLAQEPLSIMRRPRRWRGPRTRPPAMQELPRNP